MNDEKDANYKRINWNEIASEQTQSNLKLFLHQRAFHSKRERPLSTVVNLVLKSQF